MHILWLAALLLALIDLPDFGSSLGRIADSTETLAGRKSRDGAAELPPKAMADPKHTNVTVVPREDAPAATLARVRLRRARSWIDGIIIAVARWWRRVSSSRTGTRLRNGAAGSLPETTA